MEIRSSPDPLNAEEAIPVNFPDASFTSFKLLHPEKTAFPSSATLAGTVSSGREMQFPKADSPMEASPSGSVTPVTRWQPKKAPFPMEVTPSGISTFPSLPMGQKISSVMPLLYKIPSLEVKYGFLLSTAMYVRLMLSENGTGLMLEIFAPNATARRGLHLEKDAPRETTFFPFIWSGMAITVSLPV